MDIVHGLDIETTPEKLFAALSTDRGISGWWTKTKIQGKVGGSAEFDFGGGTVTFRVEKLEPGKVVGWVADDVPPDWIGSHVLFEIGKGEGTSVTLRFSHTAFKEMNAFMANCSYVWAQYLRSLKLFLETGKGEPFGSPASLAAGSTPR